MSVADKLATLASDIGDCYDEVQTKGGTIPQNKNTNNLANAIGSIPSGSTPIGQISITQNGTYDVTDYASASVAVPNDDTELVALINGTLTEIENANVTSVKRNCFRESIIQRAVFPNCVNVLGSAFTNSDLVLFDVGKRCNFNASSFSNCFDFTTLIMRSNQVCSIGNINAFTSTPFRNGTGGTAYVPQSLVSTYQNATNWSSLESTTFSAIQESLVALNTLGIDITDYYTIVSELPTSDISTSKVYFIETATAGTYEQWLYSGSAWTQLADITLGGSQ